MTATSKWVAKALSLLEDDDFPLVGLPGSCMLMEMLGVEGGGTSSDSLKIKLKANSFECFSA